jgi:hypothetical protein
MSHKIAIITSKELGYNRYGDDYSNDMVISSITDWAEVTDEEYRDLCQATAYLNFHILEQPTDIKEFIPNTINEWKKKVKAEVARREAERKLREEKALERKHKKDLKDKESKKKLLEKLRAELGE